MRERYFQKNIGINFEVNEEKRTKKGVEQKYTEQKEEKGLKEKSMEPEPSEVCDQSLVAITTNCTKSVISYK